MIDDRKRAPETSNFGDTLARVLRMAHGAEESEQSRAALRSELQALSPKFHARLGALLNIGRDAYDAMHGRSNPSASTSPAPLDALALCDGMTLSQRYLERGLAAACAGRLTLDGTVTRESRAEQRPSVSERAWLRFGQELASSEPGEWSWFACSSDRSRVLDKLYVRRGTSAWWSFATGIDRPLREQIDVDRRRAKNVRPHNQGSSLESLLNQQGSPARPALRRALTSVHARLGKVRGARSAQ